MLNRRRFLTIAAAGLACPAAAATREWHGRALGADVTLKLAGAADPSGRIWAKVERALRRVEAAFSLFSESELVRLNRLGRLSWPSADMLALARLADELHAATAGAFDPSVQPLWRAVAQGAAPDTARARTGWTRVEISDSVIALGQGMALTFNGIAQGFAADRLAGLLRAEGFTDVLIDAGEVQALGQAQGEASGQTAGQIAGQTAGQASGQTAGQAEPRDWQAGIAGPDGRILHRVSLRDRALATSSPMGTRIGHDQPHILHPDGRPPKWNTVSVSAPSAALADGLSTAFCLMGRAGIASALARFPDARVEFLG